MGAIRKRAATRDRPSANGVRLPQPAASAAPARVGTAWGAAGGLFHADRERGQELFEPGGAAGRTGDGIIGGENEMFGNLSAIRASIFKEGHNDILPGLGITLKPEFVGN